MKLDTKTRTPVGRVLTDGLFQRYTSWRNESNAVQRAYEAWVSSDSANRELAYAGYLAALDQEELAAEAYRDELAWIRTVSGGTRS
jgi:hypothetical protein